MPQTQINQPRTAIVGLVRDANGKPLFDDPANAPGEMKAMLTDDDCAKLSDQELTALNLMHRKRA